MGAGGDGMSAEKYDREVGHQSNHAVGLASGIAMYVSTRLYRAFFRRARKEERAQKMVFLSGSPFSPTGDAAVTHASIISHLRVRPSHQHSPPQPLPG